MPDAPDSFRYSHITTLTPSQDINELAAKLGSPSTMFREGQVIYENGFDKGLSGLTLQYSPAANIPYVSNNDYTMYSASIEMPNTEFDTGECQISKKLPIFDTRYYYFSTLFTPSTYNLTGIALYLYEDGIVYYARIKFDITNSKIYLYNSDADDIEIPNVNMSFFTSAGVIRVSLKIDVLNAEYTALIIGNTEYDLTAYPMKTNTTVVKDNLLWQMWVEKNKSTSDALLYVHSIVVACSD